MNTIKNVSQKNCVRLLEKLNAIRLTHSNVYYYESYLNDTNRLIDILDINIKRDEWNRYLITKWKLYYSCGIYGNSGQLHYIQYK